MLSLACTPRDTCHTVRASVFVGVAVQREICKHTPLDIDQPTYRQQLFLYTSKRALHIKTSTTHQNEHQTCIAYMKPSSTTHRDIIPYTLPLPALTTRTLTPTYCTHHTHSQAHTESLQVSTPMSPVASSKHTAAGRQWGTTRGSWKLPPPTFVTPLRVMV